MFLFVQIVVQVDSHLLHAQILRSSARVNRDAIDQVEAALAEFLGLPVAVMVAPHGRRATRRRALARHRLRLFLDLLLLRTLLWF